MLLGGLMGSITSGFYFPPTLDDVGSDGRGREERRDRELYFDASAARV